jgi:hypothetical protein
MALPKSILTVNTSETAIQLVEKPGNKAQEPSPLYHLAIAFLVVFVPLLVIPLILLAYILKGWPGYWGVDLASASGSCHELPGNQNNSDSYFYTTIALNYVVLTSSWLSNVAQFATAPFLFLFSFLVASRFILHGEPASDTTFFGTTDRYNEIYPIRRLLEGTPSGVYQWLKDFLLDKHNARESTVGFTALGSMLALVLR